MENSLLYALAGLLHDIGKFGQRADVSFDYSKELDTQSKNLAGHICNWSEKGYFTHQHVLWTNRFLETHKNLFEKVNLYGEGENNMFNLACYHHKPATLEHAIITMADHWSSGIDRNSDRVLGKNATYGRDSFRSVPFMSIFSELSTLKNPTGLTSGDFGYPLQPLSINEDIFPIPSAEINLKEAYPKLWQSFNEEVCKIDTKDAIAFIYTLFHLLKKYTWYIPASTMDYPNCSLFEHLKTTSAFSHCIHSYYTENKDAFSFSALNKLNLDSKHYPVKMVCGDISGIQSFIYNISNKSAMKGLKGRSFYVQLPTETISEELLQTCGASITNLIYAAGGKFYILVPNTSQVNDAIETYKQQIQEKLWDEYAGKITVHIASVDFSMQKEGEELKVCTPSFTEKIHVGELWKLLAEKTSRQKKIKYNHIVSTRFDELFTPFGQGGDINVCAVTSEELSKSNAVNLELKYREQGESDDDVLVSKAVHKQIEIGSKLYDARYLVKHIKGKQPTISK
ncbi:MAG: type III-A CRISPR-associated protein Cas10/Csm1 [Bacteroidetes bacterium]|nr:type III-A CRISPR-associated protein Cas10/Csm1 [Bacteroidota bacterium]